MSRKSALRLAALLMVAAVSCAVSALPDADIRLVFYSGLCRVILKGKKCLSFRYKYYSVRLKGLS